jgi:hypothetical protein
MMYRIPISCVFRIINEIMLTGMLRCYIDFVDVALYLLAGPDANPGTFEYLSSLSVLNVI